MSESVYTGDPQYETLMALHKANHGAQVLYDHTGLAWLVFILEDVPHFVSMERDDPRLVVPHTDGRWNKLYGYTPVETEPT